MILNYETNQLKGKGKNGTKKLMLFLASMGETNLHSVSYVYAVLPFYDVKCLCSGGQEWRREGSHSH